MTPRNEVGARVHIGRRRTIVMSLKCIASCLSLALAVTASGCVALSGGADSEQLGRGEQALDSATVFYVPPPNPGAKDQIALLRSTPGGGGDAALIRDLVTVPHAEWFTGDT